MMSMLYVWIVLLSFGLINAVPLNGDCRNGLQCDGTGVVCRDDKCQCNIPFYNPCKTACEVNRHFAYEGQTCQVTENCIEHASCQVQKCQCDNGYTAKNGVCFKTMYSACANNSECWSGYCSQSRCQCAPGLETGDNITTCRVKLVDVYNNWSEANEKNAFCANDDSCFDILGTCVNDPAHPQSKFCKCPDGYAIRTDAGRPRCEAVQGQYLSPLDEREPLNYGECGTCKDENAVCIDAATKRTCWCRTGYEKKGTSCVSRGKPRIVFPNAEDARINNFTAGCSREANGADKIQDQLCGCAPGYKFQHQNLPCKKIELTWQSEYLEYGVCTQITSRDSSRSENGVCPEPFKCEARTDKHVCSCGRDKFQDLDDPTQCVYYIGKGANGVNHKCPTNARNGTTGNCECLEGYKATPDNRQCELKLSSNLVDGTCNVNVINHQICQIRFGVTARLCNVGECRCPGVSSFPSRMNDRCYALVNRALTSPIEECPPNSTLRTNTCTCVKGFRPSNDLQECVRLNVSLTENRGSPISSNVDDADCQALYKGPVAVYDNDHCHCQSNAYVNENMDGCRYRLGTSVSTAQAVFCPMNGAADANGICVCDKGFREENNICVRMTNRVYPNNTLTAPNVVGIDNVVCRKFFGQGSSKAPGGDYCICLPIAYSVKNDTYCHFLLNVSSNDFKSPESCPDNSINYPQAVPSACICNPGYHPSTNNRTCELANVDLVGVETVDNTRTCTRYTDNDCTAKYGPQAFCNRDQCYCNRQLSYMTDDKQCESFSNYKFPGAHELSLYTCTQNSDCTGDGVICDYIYDNADYRVCRCKDGSFLDLKLQQCVPGRCIGCDESKNFECHGYVCQCKKGFVQQGSNCVPYTEQLKLYQPCNRSISRGENADPSMVCDSNCDYTTCNVGYRLDQSKCVPHQLGSDRCLYQEEVCAQIDRNAACNRDANRCSCKPSYYQLNDRCARAVGYPCEEDEECGNGICKGNRCACKEEQRLNVISDALGREISRCVNVNGFDPLRANSVALFLFLILARIFFN